MNPLLKTFVVGLIIVISSNFFTNGQSIVSSSASARNVPQTLCNPNNAKMCITASKSTYTVGVDSNIGIAFENAPKIWRLVVMPKELTTINSKNAIFFERFNRNNGSKSIPIQETMADKEYNVYITTKVFGRIAGPMLLKVESDKSPSSPTPPVPSPPSIPSPTPPSVGTTELCNPKNAKMCITASKSTYTVGVDSNIVIAFENAPKIWRLVVMPKELTTINSKNAIFFERFNRNNGSKSIPIQETMADKEYNVYITTKVFGRIAGPMLLKVESDKSPTPPVPSPPSVPSPTPPSVGTTELCNPKNAKMCITASKSTYTVGVDSNIAIAFKNAPKIWRLVVMPKELTTINSKNAIFFERFNRNNGSKSIPIRGTMADKEYNIYITTKVFGRIAGPMLLKVQTQTDEPTKQPSPAPTEAPTDSPTPAKVCGVFLNDYEEALARVKNLETGTNTAFEGLDEFGCKSDSNGRFLSTTNNVKSKLSKGLEFFSGGPLGWLSFGFSVGLWIASSQDTTTQQILDEVKEISSKIDSLSNQVSQGFNSLTQLIDLSYEGDKMKTDSEVLNTLSNRYKNFLEDPSNYRDAFVQKCNDHTGIGFQPIDIFKRFYAAACKECKHFDVTYTGAAQAIRKFENYFNSQWTVNDEYNFRTKFGKVVLRGMLNAFLMHTQCISNSPRPKCEDDIWLRDFDKMKEALEEVEAHINERSPKLSFCPDKKIRLRRVSYINTDKLEGTCDDDFCNSMELQFRLNDKLYMPTQHSHCYNGMCERYCGFNTGGWDDKTCQVRGDRYQFGPFNESPWKTVNRDQNLRFTGKEADHLDPHDYFYITTFYPKEWYDPFENSCGTHVVQHIRNVNGESGSKVELEVEPAVKRSGNPICN